MKTCALCGNNQFESVLELGELPLGYPVSQKNPESMWKEQFKIELCNECLMGQTVKKIPEEKLTSENLYHIISKSVSSHNEKFFSLINSLLDSSKNPLILEIGSGDGTFLHNLQKYGFSNTIGIEPSPHSGIKYDFEVIVDFFNEKIVDKLKNEKKIPDLIIASYVLELIPNIEEFFKNLANLMKEGSIILIDVPYLIDVIQNQRIDSCAHLRCNWFTINSLIFAFQKFGFQVLEIQHDKEFRAGTITAIAKKSSKPFNLNSNISNMIKKEKNELTPHHLSTFRKIINENRTFLRQKILDLKKENLPIYGYGGGRKPSTLLNWLKLTSENISIIVDVDHNMHGKNVPIANIPIFPTSKLPKKNEKPIIVIILALDYINELIPMLKEKLPRGSIIVVPLPKFTTILVDND